MIRHTTALCAFATALLMGASPAPADMFRCVASDGSVTFTDNATGCPGAVKHETADRVQTVPSSRNDTPAAPARTQRDRLPSLEEQRAQKQVWQQKKREAEARLQSLEEREERLRRVVVGCNRGAEIVTRDTTGMKYEIPCSEIRREHQAAETEAEELREYLETGLQRECREAGCLPGWIR